MRPAGTFDVTYAEDMAIVRTRLQWILVALFVAFIIVLPNFSDLYWLDVLVVMGITLIAVFGLHITTGLCGQINLGQSAFMAVGAYTSAILTNAWGGEWFLVVLPLAGINAGIVGMIFGAPSLKIKEFYLAMATMAAQFIIVYFLMHFDEFLDTTIFGGPNGLGVSPATIFGFFEIDTDFRMYYLVMALVVIMGLFALNMTRTRVGRAFVAVRDNDLAAEVMGINLFYYKLLSFFIGCFFAGIAGALVAHYYLYIQPEQFTLHNSVWYLGMLVVGGMGSILGTVFGTVFITLLDALAYNVAPFISDALPYLPQNITYIVGIILFAIVVIVFLIYEPRGLSHRWRIFKASYRLWPYAY